MTNFPKKYQLAFDGDMDLSLLCLFVHISKYLWDNKKNIDLITRNIFAVSVFDVISILAWEITNKFHCSHNIEIYARLQENYL
jgi:hypothetical protein